ncbi:MAG: DoxX family protein [Rhodothermales bacterium]|nr:DoxX family protein [Rhodothermales bacterium]
MSPVYHALAALSIGLFLYYGFSCLFSEGMVEEFERFGLSRFRRTTGALEMLGALGLILGYAVPEIAALSAAGLTVLMILGTWTRIRVGDAFVEMIPAIVLGAVNAVLVWMALGRI